MLREGLFRHGTNMYERMERNQRGDEGTMDLRTYGEKFKLTRVQVWGQRSVHPFAPAQCHVKLTDGHWPSPYGLRRTPEIKMDLGFLTFALCEKKAPGIHQNDTQRAKHTVCVFSNNRRELASTFRLSPRKASSRLITSRFGQLHWFALELR